MKRLTKNQKLMWAKLQGRAAVLLCHSGTVDQIANDVATELASITNQTQMLKIADECMGVILSRKLPPVSIIKIFRYWLGKYQIALSPNGLSNFDRFHKRYGKYILKGSNMHSSTYSACRQVLQETF